MKEKRGDVNRHPDNLFALIFIHINDDLLLGGSRGRQGIPGGLERSLPKLSLTKGNESLRSRLIVPHRMDFSQGSVYDSDCTPAAGYAPHLPRSLGSLRAFSKPGGNWESWFLPPITFSCHFLLSAVQLLDP